MKFKASYNFVLSDSDTSFECGETYDMNVKEAEEINKRGKNAYPDWDKPFLVRVEVEKDAKEAEEIKEDTEDEKTKEDTEDEKNKKGE